MYQGNNPIAIQSQKFIIQALLLIMHTKEFAKIQIKELCAGAQVSRQTFYTLFDSKEQILELYFDQIFAGFKQEIKKQDNLSLPSICSAAVNHFISHAIFIELLIKNKLDYMLYQKLEQYLSDFSKEISLSDYQEHEYAIAFLSGALTGMIRKHIENNQFNDDHTISYLVEQALTGNYFKIDSD